MELTALEIIMGGAILSGVVGIGTWLITSSRYQTKAQCDERYKGACASISKVEHAMETKDSKAVRMMQAIISFLPLTPEQREHILNDRGAK